MFREMSHQLCRAVGKTREKAETGSTGSQSVVTTGHAVTAVI